MPKQARNAAPQTSTLSGGMVAIALVILSGTAPAQSPADAARPLRLLFVGNSLTAANDLPRLVETVTEASGQPRLFTRTIAVGGFSLEDHWNQGEARRVIAEGGWDVVILQQGPSAMLESRCLLVDYARRFAEIIRQAGGKPALYMVWPSLDRRQDFTGVSLSYRAAARAVGAAALPVGDAWRLVLQQHRGVKLYSEDRFHRRLPVRILQRSSSTKACTIDPAWGCPHQGFQSLKQNTCSKLRRKPQNTEGGGSLPATSSAILISPC